jgi:hypothetical protein
MTFRSECGTQAAGFGTVGCSERQALARAVAEVLQEMKHISEQLIAALQNNASYAINEIYPKLSKAEREHERRMQVLREHEIEHGCTSGRIPRSPWAGQVEPQGTDS